MDCEGVLPSPRITSSTHSSAAAAAVAAGGNDRSAAVHHEPIIRTSAPQSAETSAYRPLDRKLMASGAVKLMLPGKYNGFRGTESGCSVFDALPGSKAGQGIVELPVTDTAIANGGKLRALPKALMPKDARRASQQQQQKEQLSTGYSSVTSNAQPRRSSVTGYPLHPSQLVSSSSSSEAVASIPPQSATPADDDDVGAARLSDVSGRPLRSGSLYSNILATSSSVPKDAHRRGSTSVMEAPSKRFVVYEPNPGLLMLRQQKADREVASINGSGDDVVGNAERDEGEVFPARTRSPALTTGGPKRSVFEPVAAAAPSKVGTSSTRRSSFADSYSFFASSEDADHKKVLPVRPSFMPKPLKYLQFNSLDAVAVEAGDPNAAQTPRVGQPETVRTTTTTKRQFSADVPSRGGFSSSNVTDAGCCVEKAVSKTAANVADDSMLSLTAAAGAEAPLTLDSDWYSPIPVTRRTVIVRESTAAVKTSSASSTPEKDSSSPTVVGRTAAAPWSSAEDASQPVADTGRKASMRSSCGSGSSSSSRATDPIVNDGAGIAANEITVATARNDTSGCEVLKAEPLRAGRDDDETETSADVRDFTDDRLRVRKQSACSKSNLRAASDDGTRVPFRAQVLAPLTPAVKSGICDLSSSALSSVTVTVEDAIISSANDGAVNDLSTTEQSPPPSSPSDTEDPPPLPVSLPPPLPTSLPPPLNYGVNSDGGATLNEVSTALDDSEDSCIVIGDNEDEETNGSRYCQPWTGSSPNGTGNGSSAILGWYWRSTTTSHHHRPTDSTATVDSGHGSVSGCSGLMSDCHEDHALSSADELDVAETVRQRTPGCASKRQSPRPGHLQCESLQSVAKSAAVHDAADEGSLGASPPPSRSTYSLTSPTSDVITDCELDDCTTFLQPFSSDGQQLNRPNVADASSADDEDAPCNAAGYDVSHVVVPVPTNGLLTQLLAESGRTLADLEQQTSSSDEKRIEPTDSSAAKPVSEVVVELNNVDDRNGSASSEKGREVQSDAVIFNVECSRNSSDSILTEDGKRLFDIAIVKGSVGLGFCIEGGTGSPTGDRPISVKRLFRTGDNSGLGDLKPGDEIVAVNGVSYSGLSHYEAWGKLKSLPDGPSVLTVARNSTIAT